MDGVSFWWMYVELSAGTGIVQPFAVCRGASVIVATPAMAISEVPTSEAY
jgi:hypothetical protein